jgi:Undecaprenyl-phosphate glucose phosphotransferase
VLDGKSHLLITDCGTRRTKARHHFFASESGVSQLVRLVDVLIFSICSSVAFSINVDTYFYGAWEYCASVAVAVVIFVSLFQRAGLYDFETVVLWPRRMLTVTVMMIVALGVLAVLGFAVKLSSFFSRLWLFETFASATVFMILSRGGLMFFLRREAKAGRLRRNVAIIGSGEQAKLFISHLHAEAAPWQAIVGVFDDRKSRIQSWVLGYPLLGDFAALVQRVRQGEIDTVVVALPWSADERALSILQRLRELPVHAYLGSDLLGYRFPAGRQELLGGVSVVKIFAAPLSGRQAILKAIEDYVIASLLVLVLAPVMLVCAIAVRLDSPGPVLFRQDRFGFNNQRITEWKFRSMYHQRPPEPGVPQAKKDDPRVTRVGQFLRRHSLDELPQLLNVLRGEMSLVGPRPHAVEHNETYAALIAGYDARHTVKPGITGWAQVNGLRGEITEIEMMRQRVKFDIYYIENWSLLFDIQILLLSLPVVYRQGTAY